TYSALTVLSRIQLLLLFFFFILLRSPPSSTLFPYTTLFRSQQFDSAVQVFEKQSIALSSSAKQAKQKELQQLQQRLELFLLGLRSEEHTSELQSRFDLVCRLLLEKKNKDITKFLIIDCDYDS